MTIHDPKNEVQNTLANKYVHGTDISLDLNDASDFPVGGGIIRVDDGAEWALLEYTGISTNTLTGLTGARAVNESTASYTFRSGTDVYLVQAADYNYEIGQILKGNSPWPAGQDAGGYSINNVLSLTFNADGTLKPGADSATAFQFQNAAGSSTVLNIDTTNERVGIGMANPIAELHIEDQGVAELKLEDAANSVSFSLYAGTDGGTTTAFWGGTNNDLKFGTNNTERMRIEAGGNVGIGMTGPNYLLDVDGAISCRDMTAPSNTAGQSLFYSNSGEMIVMDDAGNTTQLSPHNDQNEWIFFSKNIRTGKTVRVNMEKFIKAVEEHIGQQFMEVSYA